MNPANAFAALLLAHKAIVQDDRGQGLVRGAKELKLYVFPFKGGNPDETEKGLAKLSGGKVKHVYTQALDDAALTILAQAAAALASSPTVATIKEDSHWEDPDNLKVNASTKTID